MRKFTLLITLLLAALMVTPVMAQEETPEPDPEATEEAMDMPTMDGDTFVRFAHFAPNAGAVDIYVNGDAGDLTEVEFGVVSGWIPVTPAEETYDVDVVAAGTAIEDAVISLDDVAISAGQWNVFAVTEDAEGNPTVIAATQNINADLVPATANITFVNGLGGDQTIDFNRDGVPFFTGLPSTGMPFGSIFVDSGTYTFSYATSGETGEMTAEPEEIDMLDGNYYLIAAAGEDGELIVEDTTPGEVAVLTGQIEEPGTVVQAIEGYEAYEGWADVIETAGLTETLSEEGPFTVLLPAPYLLDEISAAVGEDTELLAEILTAHVIEGDLRFGNLRNMETVTALSGDEYTLGITEGLLTVGGVAVIGVNNGATNGVLHTIDGVLGPAGEGINTERSTQGAEATEDAMNAEGESEEEMDDSGEEMDTEEDTSEEEMDTEEDTSEEEMDDSGEDEEDGEGEED